MQRERDKENNQGTLTTKEQAVLSRLPSFSSPLLTHGKHSINACWENRKYTVYPLARVWERGAKNGEGKGRNNPVC